ncbi:hypothetical protein CANARDRAFT_8382 [[Candida] arabinofermentans NRRL YB-2248]|uniref:Transcription regulator Rua1 C-terminal domain-containing protein n=1 Tax=[Candida] arabinofermentans NRRL YB-2248 TaxID=983967 RepID=A0A1E4SZ92_9ASCO|nr:hypothetical protein CANARDRAFT_8382 [[Candida] arabinofermentans NRRL YB-2248]
MNITCLPHVTFDKLCFIEKWNNSTRESQKHVSIEELELINYSIENLDVESKENQLDSSLMELHKGTIALSLSTNDPYLTDRTNELVPNSGEAILISEEFHKLKNNSISSVFSEKPLLSTELSPSDGIIEYWDASSIKPSILQPQTFQHHKLDTIYQAEQSESFQFEVRSTCPKSPSEKQMRNNQLMLNDQLKLNAIQNRYVRYSTQTGRDSDISVMCRMCPHKRWIQNEFFLDHMALAHGIVNISSNPSKPDIVVLPLPTKIFKLTPRKIKRYHCQCPKCFRWFRMGHPELTKLPSQFTAAESESSKLKRGLFTEYFLHFMECSRTEQPIYVQ